MTVGRKNQKLSAKNGGRKRRGRKRGLSIVFKIIWGLVFLGLGCAVAVFLLVYQLQASLPHIGPLLEGYDPPQTTRVVAADGETVLGEIFHERRTVEPLERIPQVMVDAVIAAEDADFRNHEGLDYRGMIRAMITNVLSGRMAQGASTITQQVARTFFLTREKKITRKVREILLTWRIEERLTKDEILFLYLNQINFGHARYGVAEATRFYFGKDVSKLELHEAAMLAGIPKGPSVYSPLRNPEACLGRRSYVINMMRRNEMIDAAAAETAKQSPLGVTEHIGYDSRLAPEVVELALSEVAGIVPREELKNGGYLIETTINPAWQRAAREAVRAGLSEIDARHGRTAPFKARGKRKKTKSSRLSLGRIYKARVVAHDDQRGSITLELNGRRGEVSLERYQRYNPKGLKPSQFAALGISLRVSLRDAPGTEGPLTLNLEIGPQAALVAAEAGTGSIKVLVGGDDMGPGEFNRALSAKRQPGSTFKPFVYLTALKSREYTPATLLDDAPEVDGEWQPQNTSVGEFSGRIALRQALARSLNLPAVKLIRAVGPESVAELANQLGIASHLEPVPSLGLGSSEITPFELAAAYSTIAAGGDRVPLHVVQSVRGPEGRELVLPGRVPDAVIAPEEAYLITSLMQSVVTEGTGGKAARLGRPVVGKTGTSNEGRDAWFAGFTPDVVAVVWVGFDDFRSIGKREYGSRAALPIWLDFMKTAHKDQPKREFEQPEGIVTVQIDPQSGLLAYEGMEGAIFEKFLEGTEPTETAVPPDTLTLDSFLLEAAETIEEPDTDSSSESQPSAS